jgi:hypothetical protein
MTIKDFQTYKTNPTIPDGIIYKDYVIKEDEIEMVIPSTGEVGIFRKASQLKNIKHDSLEYVKVYKGGLLKVRDLNTPALKVWTYILANLTPKRDEVAVYMKDCMEYTGYTNPPPIYKGIVELLEKEFLFRKVGTESAYFINSNFFFNGKRI